MEERSLDIFVGTLQRPSCEFVNLKAHAEHCTNIAYIMNTFQNFQHGFLGSRTRFKLFIRIS